MDNFDQVGRSANSPLQDATNFEVLSPSAQTAQRKSDPPLDLVCFSHLRWDFVFQRPQHLLTRCAGKQRTFYIEEPIYDAAVPHLKEGVKPGGVVVVVPHLPARLSELVRDRNLKLAQLVERYFRAKGIQDFVLWYYTPMALDFTRQLSPVAVVYDCMDELANFKFAPPELCLREKELLAKADVVFTGGHTLYESKKHCHDNIFPFPSSVDVPHFKQAREFQPSPADQRKIPRPRLGFFGVIDERMDLDLVKAAAESKPAWQFVFLGPVCKIPEDSLPRLANIHYLGPKKYEELPVYLAGWDVALLPFARNDATKFISPTKTPEYLAAGKPVVSTSIRDVMRPYGEKGLVSIADTPAEFVRAVDQALSPDLSRGVWLQKVDRFLSQMSWDETWAQMKAEVTKVCSVRGLRETAR